MHRFRKIATFVSIIALAGCTNIPHNDVLVFATTTKVALDVSPSPTNGGVPSFTLGYKRDEGVWMPLVMNGKSAVILSGDTNCTADKKQCFAMSAAAREMFNSCIAKTAADACLSAALGQVKYVGVDGIRQDTYSVFASFGGDFSASGGGKAGINQFFATGIAAQNLARSAGISKALIAQDPDAAAAEAASEQARLSTQLALRALGAVEGAKIGIKRLSVIEKALDCWDQGRAAYAAEAHVKLDPTDTQLANVFDGNDATDLREAIEFSPDMSVVIDEITKSVCPPK